MTFFILKGHIATLFVCFKFSLILTFPHPVENFGGGSLSEILVTKDLRLNRERTIIINPKTDKLETNIIISTKSRSYRFYIKYDENRCMDFVDIFDGKVNGSYQFSKETNSYKLYQGKTSIKIENRTQLPIYINDLTVKNYRYFSKGIPLFIKTISAKRKNRDNFIIEGK